MTPAARRPGVPRGIAVTWALATLVGGITIGVAAARPEPQLRTLSPRTVARYLARHRPRAARRRPRQRHLRLRAQRRVADRRARHLARRRRHYRRRRHHLPVLAGEPAWDSPIDRSRFDSEHAMGWTLDDLATVLARLDGTDDDLALVELEITALRESVIACHGSRADMLGHCVERDRRGREVRTFDAHLTDDPLGQALAVQRA